MCIRDRSLRCPVHNPVWTDRRRSPAHPATVENGNRECTYPSPSGRQGSEKGPTCPRWHACLRGSCSSFWGNLSGGSSRLRCLRDQRRLRGHPLYLGTLAIKIG